MAQPVYEAVVIGAGICGLSALYHLERLGVRRLALIDQFEPGHTHGSSHGTSRITRSSYDKDVYVELMQVAHETEWPRLERDSGRRLIHPTPGVLFGPQDGPIAQYAEAVQRVGIPIEVLQPSDAQRRAPWFRYAPQDMVILDPTCAVIAAADALSALAEQSTLAERHFDTRVTHIDYSRTPIIVHTARGEICTERLIVAAGPWVSGLIPGLRSHVSVIRQTVGYFEMEGSKAAYEPGTFPVWIYLEKDRNEHFYGLPQFQRSGIKVARHVTSGQSQDPDTPAVMDDTRLDDLRRFISRKFQAGMRELVGTEHCHYTNTLTTDYILDHHPETPRVVIGAGFSGHGFKLGPVSGRILAELAIEGQTTVAPYERNRALFCIPTA